MQLEYRNTHVSPGISIDCGYSSEHESSWSFLRTYRVRLGIQGIHLPSQIRVDGKYEKLDQDSTIEWDVLEIDSFGRVIDNCFPGDREIYIKGLSRGIAGGIGTHLQVFQRILNDRWLQEPLCARRRCRIGIRQSDLWEPTPPMIYWISRAKTRHVAKQVRLNSSRNQVPYSRTLRALNKEGLTRASGKF